MILYVSFSVKFNKKSRLSIHKRRDFYMVTEAGLEPAHPIRTSDFKSDASTYSANPA